MTVVVILPYQLKSLKVFCHETVEESGRFRRGFLFRFEFLEAFDCFSQSAHLLAECKTHEVASMLGMLIESRGGMAATPIFVVRCLQKATSSAKPKAV